MCENRLKSDDLQELIIMLILFFMVQSTRNTLIFMYFLSLRIYVQLREFIDLIKSS